MDEVCSKSNGNFVIARSVSVRYAKYFVITLVEMFEKYLHKNSGYPQMIFSMLIAVNDMSAKEMTARSGSQRQLKCAKANQTC